MQKLTNSVINLFVVGTVSWTKTIIHFIVGEKREIPTVIHLYSGARKTVKQVVFGSSIIPLGNLITGDKQMI